MSARRLHRWRKRTPDRHCLPLAEWPAHGAGHRTGPPTGWAAKMNGVNCSGSLPRIRAYSRACRFGIDLGDHAPRRIGTSDDHARLGGQQMVGLEDPDRTSADHLHQHRSIGSHLAIMQNEGAGEVGAIPRRAAPIAAPVQARRRFPPSIDPRRSRDHRPAKASIPTAMTGLAQRAHYDCG